MNSIDQALKGVFEQPELDFSKYGLDLDGSVLFQRVLRAVMAKFMDSDKTLSSRVVDACIVSFVYGLEAGKALEFNSVMGEVDGTRDSAGQCGDSEQVP